MFLSPLVLTTIASMSSVYGKRAAQSMVHMFCRYLTCKYFACVFFQDERYDVVFDIYKFIYVTLTFVHRRFHESQPAIGYRF